MRLTAFFKYYWPLGKKEPAAGSAIALDGFTPSPETDPEECRGYMPSAGCADITGLSRNLESHKIL
jgi:hypothetical protein